MKPFIAIVASSNGAVTKYQDFDTQAEADAHIAEHGGFAASKPSDSVKYWIADDVAETLTHDAITEVADEAARPALEQMENDLSALRNGGKDIALVLTELIDYLLANTAMTANDFTPSVKQAYLDLKTIADRVK